MDFECGTSDAGELVWAKQRRCREELGGHMQRTVGQGRWLLVAIGTLVLVVAAGCGRVDLEDLTPEAVRTQEAADATEQAANPPAGGSDGGTPATDGSGGGAVAGDVAAGRSIYNTECAGCHEQGRAASLIGQSLDPATIIPQLRSGEGFTAPHPVYRPTDIRPLSDNDFQNIFAFLASE